MNYVDIIIQINYLTVKWRTIETLHLTTQEDHLLVLSESLLRKRLTLRML